MTSKTDEASNPSNPTIGQITRLLHELSDQNPRAMQELLSLMQKDMRRIARRERVAINAGATMSTTALVNETYLKLQQGPLPAFKDRQHFYALVTRAMRFVLADYARARFTEKRGGGVTLESLELGVDPEGAQQTEAARILELNDALDRLEGLHPRLASVVHLRYYAGLSDVEIGELLGVEQSTVRRDWLKARGWLYQQLHSDA